MKKIVLIGDSIRLGYEKYVKEAFEGVAEVYSPTENCRFAEYTLRFAHEWKAKGAWPAEVDAVHWNAGLWDVIRIFGDDPLTPRSAYESFIERINNRLKMMYPNAKIIFVTSTAVNEEGYKGDFKRRNSDIEEYNAIARSVLEGSGTLINDLYAVTKDIPDACRSDMTHFNTPEGVKVMGGVVVKYLCGVLGISEDDLAKAKSEAVSIPEKILGM